MTWSGIQRKNRIKWHKKAWSGIINIAFGPQAVSWFLARWAIIRSYSGRQESVRLVAIGGDSRRRFSMTSVAGTGAGRAHELNWTNWTVALCHYTPELNERVPGAWKKCYPSLNVISSLSFLTSRIFYIIGNTMKFGIGLNKLQLSDINNIDKAWSQTWSTKKSVYITPLFPDSGGPPDFVVLGNAESASNRDASWNP